jgi:mono/diheme cytochrome c family protein
MPSCKKTIRSTAGYLILALNTMATSHLAPSSEVTTGKKIYHDRCAVCHGNQGNGKTFAANALFPSPKNFTATTTIKQLNRKRMIRSVKKGRPGSAMMPWENILNKREIYLVVDYIRQVLMGLQE